MSTFTLPDLPYAYDALSPYLSAEPMELHHAKHHKAYIDKANELIVGTPFEGKSLEDVVRAAYGDAQHAGLYNQASQHWNHVQFWQCMTPNGGGRKIPAALEKAINESFGSFDQFRADFIAAGMTQFGSGWSWLVRDADGKLAVMKTANADSPFAMGKTTLLGADVWEHTYYLDYRNLRAKYLEAFVDNLINWDYVVERFEA